MDLTPKGASAMEWVTPQHEEIDLNCEVSSYAFVNVPECA